MKVHIEHVGVYVTDLEQTKAFYTTYFDAHASPKYHNPHTGLETHFLSFNGAVELEIMKRPVLHARDTRPTVGWDHLTFSVGSRSNVDELTAQLAKDGYNVVSGPRTTGDGYYESVVLDPDGNRIELTV